MTDKINFKIELNLCGRTIKLDADLSKYSLREEIEKIIKNFLGLSGYTDDDKDRVMLMSVTDEEYDDLMDYLKDLRTEKDNMPHWELESNAVEPNPMFKVFHCSKCDGVSAQLTQYCPHCGARIYSGREMLGGLSNE